jgi:type IV pilus assembly protein PilO
VELPAFLDPIVTAPRWQKVLFGLLPLAAILVGGYFLVIAPVEARIGSLKTQNASLQKELQQSRAIIAEMARFRREITALEGQLATVKEKLPTEREMPPLYQRVTDAAFQAGLGVALFQPKEPRISDYYSEVPIALTAEGGYHQLGEFFEKLAALPRLVTVGDFKLAGLSKSKNPLRAELTLATYIYRPVGSAPPPKAPGAKK